MLASLPFSLSLTLLTGAPSISMSPSGETSAAMA